MDAAARPNQGLTEVLKPVLEAVQSRAVVAFRIEDRQKVRVIREVVFHPQSEPQVLSDCVNGLDVRAVGFNDGQLSMVH